MAYNYSYSEMQDMQADAIRRVREMQRQAKVVTNEEKKEPSEKPSKKADQQSKGKIKQTPPKEEPLKKEAAPTPIPTNTANNTNRTTQMPRNRGINIPTKFNLQNKLGFLENQELSEQALLIALLILLMNEKADTALILAILYILSG